MTRCVTHAAMLVSILVSVGTAAEPPASDEAAVRRAGKDYVAALERGDFKTAASFWTAKGTYTDETGKTWPGQQLLEQAPTSGANDRPQSNVSHVTVTFIAPDAALEEGEGECRADQGLAQMCGRFTAAWVKQDGGWRLARLIETRAEPGKAAPPQAPLAPLELFVGEWSGTLGKSALRVSAKWSPGKKFLQREFFIATDGKESFSGMQQIGWDPQTDSIHSWYFGEDGSRGEGLWSQEGGLWMVIASRVAADGTTSSSTQTYKFRDKDTIVWRSLRSGTEGAGGTEFEVKLKRTKG